MEVGTAPKHLGPVAALLYREASLALRSTRISDAAWILLGGGSLVAYGIGIAVIEIRASTALLRGDGFLWWFEVPAACSALSAAAGLALGSIASARAHAPFLAALPLSPADRRRMAVAATIPLGIAVVPAASALSATLAMLVARPAMLVAVSAFAASAFGFCAGVARATSRRRRASTGSQRAEGDGGGVPLGIFDRPGLAWIGAWAWDAAGGRLRPTVRLPLSVGAVALAVVLASGASLSRREAGPAVVAAVALGVACFMATLRFRPLASPVLRSAPIGFGAAWLRLMRLPAIVSLVAFALPAGAALAAQPSAWTAPASGALWVVALNAAYAVFAATFLTSPPLAALSFAATLGFAAYEAIEYGSAVVLAVVGLLGFLVLRARWRFRHG